MKESPISASYEQATMLKMTVLFGVIGGFVAFAYDWCMETALWIVWEVIPDVLEQNIAGNDDGKEILEKFGFLYTILTSLMLGIVVGVFIKYLGFPGDLPDTIKNVHKLGYVPMSQTLPMIFVSLSSITAGGSLGPEAPLVAISSSLSGWISMRYFNHPPEMVRKCTLIGMAAGLSAFFGVQLGGALFALEVCHTMGLQFFDVAVYAISSGGICLVIYRGLQGATFGNLWGFPQVPQSGTPELLFGICLGFVAAGVGLFFGRLHRGVSKCLRAMGLGHFEDTRFPIVLAALGGLGVGVIGVLFPPTMFWSEFEITVLANPGTKLPHVWPQGGAFYGMDLFPMDTGLVYLAVGIAKLLAISITVHSGFRGGFIFPLFFAGGALGRSLFMFLPQWLNQYVHVTPALVCMCMASGLNTAITRTAFATPLILTTLSGCPDVAAPALCAALVSLFVTRKAVFIGSQKDRQDLQFVDDLADHNTKPSAKVEEEFERDVASTLSNGHGIEEERTQLVVNETQGVGYDAI